MFLFTRGVSAPGGVCMAGGVRMAGEGHAWQGGVWQGRCALQDQWPLQRAVRSQIIIINSS